MAAKRGFKRYTNGYEAWYIDEHPHKDVLRDVSRGIFAFPEEKIVIMHDGTIVMFLESIDDLVRIEKEMRLKTKDVYYSDEDRTNNF